MTCSNDIIKQLTSMANHEIADKSMTFFKTGVGEYAEGDQFLGIRVPILRKQVSVFNQAKLDTIFACLHNEFHEIRLFSLLSLVERFNKASEEQKNIIYEYYLNNTKFINNWDLVDSSAPYIVGSYLFDKNRAPLYKLVKSDSLWERRISIIATFYLIRQSDFQDCLKLSELLLHDKHELIHKAVGWMLREIGKRDKDIETEFLKLHYQNMPRTMLRYAIEKYPNSERQAFLKGCV